MRLSNFLYQPDYLQTIRVDILKLMQNHDDSIRYTAEAQAIEEIAGYIRTQYQVENLLFTITPYDKHAIYMTGDHVEKDGVLYVAVADIPAQSTVTIAEETPAALYDKSNEYALNNLVSFNGMTYQCDQIPTASNPPTDSTRWSLVDPQNWHQIDERNPLLVMYACDISLYHLHSRISPHQIPDLRILRYERAIEWLKEVRKGTVNLDAKLYIDSLKEIEAIEEPTSANNQAIGYGARQDARNNYW